MYFSLVSFFLFLFFFSFRQGQGNVRTQNNTSTVGKKVRRKEVHAPKLNDLANCTEVKVLGEGAFGKVG